MPFWVDCNDNTWYLEESLLSCMLRIFSKAIGPHLNDVPGMVCIKTRACLASSIFSLEEPVKPRASAKGMSCFRTSIRPTLALSTINSTKARSTKGLACAP